MRFDLQKIDERIKKLQDIRRLATDPEAASLLLEFMSGADEGLKPMPVALSEGNGVANPPADSRELAKEVVNGKEAAAGSGLWTRARG
jgi:hypothetical protein